MQLELEQKPKIAEKCHFLLKVHHFNGATTMIIVPASSITDDVERLLHRLPLWVSVPRPVHGLRVLRPVPGLGPRPVAVLAADWSVSTMLDSDWLSPVLEAVAHLTRVELLLAVVVVVVSLLVTQLWTESSSPSSSSSSSSSSSQPSSSPPSSS